MYWNGVAFLSSISVKYEVLIPMTTDNLFAMVYPWDNMAVQAIDFNYTTSNICSHANREFIYEFYRVCTKF
jgi:hypothetical protein